MFRYRNIVPSQRTGIVRRSDQRGLLDRPTVKLTGGKPTLSQPAPWTVSLFVALLATTLWHFDAVEERPSTSSDPPKQHQNDNDDQDGADHTDATVTVAVTVATKSATEATEQENDEDYNEDGSERHDLCSHCRTELSRHSPNGVNSSDFSASLEAELGQDAASQQMSDIRISEGGAETGYRFARRGPGAFVHEKGGPALRSPGATGSCQGKPARAGLPVRDGEL
jgi:hypothetical protein